VPVYGRPPWPRSGPDPAPLPGVCQVWWARPGDVRPEHDALLGEADLVRRARLACPADRQRLTAGAAVARLVLGAALGTPPAALRIDRTCHACGSPHGRPRLADAVRVRRVSARQADREVQPYAAFSVGGGRQSWAGRKPCGPHPPPPAYGSSSKQSAQT